MRVTSTTLLFCIAIVVALLSSDHVVRGQQQQQQQQPEKTKRNLREISNNNNNNNGGHHRRLMNCKGANRKNTPYCRARREAGITDSVDDSQIQANIAATLPADSFVSSSSTTNQKTSNDDKNNDEAPPAYTEPDDPTFLWYQQQRMRNRNSGSGGSDILPAYTPPEDHDPNAIVNYNGIHGLKPQRKRWSTVANNNLNPNKQLRNRNQALHKDDVTVGHAMELMKAPPSRNNYQRLKKWRNKQKVEKNRQEVFKNLKDADYGLYKDQKDMEETLDREKDELDKIYKYKLKHGKWPPKNFDEDQLLSNSDRYKDYEIDEIEAWIVDYSQGLMEVEEDRIDNLKEKERMYTAEMKRLKSKLHEKNEYYAANGKYKNPKDLDRLAEQMSNVQKELDNATKDRKQYERRHAMRKKLNEVDRDLMKDYDNMDMKKYMKKRRQMRKIEKSNMEPFFVSFVKTIDEEDQDLNKLDDKLRKAQKAKQKVEMKLQGQDMFKNEHGGLKQNGGLEYDQLETELQKQDREVKMAERNRAVYLERKKMKLYLREEDEDGDALYDKKEYRAIKGQVDQVLEKQLEQHLMSDNVHKAVRDTVFAALNKAVEDHLNKAE